MVALGWRCQDLCTPAERVSSQAIGAELQKSLFSLVRRHYLKRYDMSITRGDDSVMKSRGISLGGRLSALVGNENLCMKRMIC